MSSNNTESNINIFNKNYNLVFCSIKDSTTNSTFIKICSYSTFMRHLSTEKLNHSSNAIIAPLSIGHHKINAPSRLDTTQTSLNDNH
jgi:hypothetical protein